MTKEEIIEKIKNKLLENAIAEYENGIKECNDITSRDRSKYHKEHQRLYEERVYLMQDYEAVCDISFNESELNFKY